MPNSRSRALSTRLTNSPPQHRRDARVAGVLRGPEQPEDHGDGRIEQANDRSAKAGAAEAETRAVQDGFRTALHASVAKFLKRKLDPGAVKVQASAVDR
jgi:hypothetical protein